MRFGFFVLFVLVAACAAEKPKFGFPMHNGIGRIVGGSYAERDEFMYQVSLEWKVGDLGQHVCGASIITKTWLLTAAHCITEVPPLGDYIAHAGILHLDEEIESRQSSKVITKIYHENYPGGVAPFDIAVLEVETPFVWSRSVFSIGLPRPGNIHAGNQSHLTGWGATSPGGIMPLTLHKAELTVITNDECRDAIDALTGNPQINPLADSNACTGPLTEPAISACSGDSGGPLALMDEARNFGIIGIVSWGITPCGTPGAPTVYTRVSAYIDWINAHTTTK